MSATRVTAAVSGLADVVAAELSRDGMVEVTAGVFGDLRWLRLDPRIRYDLDADALAEKILGAHRVAADTAWRSAAVLAGLPPDTRPGSVDLAFDPVLARLERRIADPRRADPDGRPVLAELVDYRSLRRYFLRMRAEITGVRETAVSGDGLITVTVGGRRELLALALDPRVSRTGSTAALAEQVLETAGKAAAQAGDRVAAISSSISANEEA